ncbi:phenylacetate--CoA ligase family protein [Sungkyunkwania multivorans]|uniref:Phenylacetate--CoA ligase family protein n=1 Tax=Sungkyunkwania multivorans TaxID=1173618 RepID=A0ABW3D4Y7_9FLAO
MMLHRSIFQLGQRYRNPSIPAWMKFLRSSDRWSREELETYQLTKLKELVSFAYEHSPYYRSIFEKENISSDEIKGLGDIEKLPILTKEQLLKNNKDIHANYKFKKTFTATTSGSSGDSLVFQREEAADSFNRAAIFRGYSWYEVQPWERNGYFWGFNFSWSERLKTWLLDTLQNRFRVFSYEEKAFKSFVMKLQSATYIHGYSSMIYQTAKLINEKRLERPKRLKLVKGTSEKIYESYQDEVEKAFGRKMISEYGAAESGIIAFECPHGKMHINMEGVIVEEMENEILLTNLQMFSFPIIRYKLGDYITLAKETEKCDCGRAHAILNEVTGRVGKSVYGHEGIYPSLYFYYIFKNLGKVHDLKLNYQVIQRTKGNLEFYVEQKMSEAEQNLLKKEIKRYFKEDISFTVIDDHMLSITNAKKKSFISHL